MRTDDLREKTQHALKELFRTAKISAYRTMISDLFVLITDEESFQVIQPVISELIAELEKTLIAN
jgi:hypothetical protein